MFIVPADDGLFCFNTNHWQEWEPFGPCQVTCGMGIQTIRRTCFEAIYGGCSDEGEIEQEDVIMCYPGDCTQICIYLICPGSPDLMGHFSASPCETEDGASCILPFLWFNRYTNKSELVEGCTLIDGDERPWCSTRYSVLASLQKPMLVCWTSFLVCQKL